MLLDVSESIRFDSEGAILDSHLHKYRKLYLAVIKKFLGIFK